MSYDTKVAAAQAVIIKHNENVETDLAVDWGAFLKALRQAGGTSEETLKAVRHEDLEEWGIPRLLTRNIAMIFRSGVANDDSKSTGSAFVSDKKAKELDDCDLIDRYNDRDRESGVFKRLKSLSGNKPFIVKNLDGTTDVNASVKLLNELRDGHEPRDMYVEEGKEPRKVYAVGDRVDAFDDKNPLYAGRKLRPDGTCDQTQRSWDGVSFELRQIVYLAVRKTGEISIGGVDDAHYVLDQVINAPESIRHRYPAAVIALRELTAEGNAPSLKVRRAKLTTTGVGVRRNDPFKYEF